VRHQTQGDIPMPNLPLPPDDLFRYYQRGMLDPDSLMNHILLNLIELDDTLKAIKALLEMMSEEVSHLDLDIDLLAQQSGLPPIP
jgi:hypothetical protein